MLTYTLSLSLSLSYSYLYLHGDSRSWSRNLTVWQNSISQIWYSPHKISPERDRLCLKVWSIPNTSMVYHRVRYQIVDFGGTLWCHQTWPWEIPKNRDLNRKITAKWFTFYRHVWLPEGIFRHTIDQDIPKSSMSSYPQYISIRFPKRNPSKTRSCLATHASSRRQAMPGSTTIGHRLAPCQLGYKEKFR